MKKPRLVAAAALSAAALAGSALFAAPALAADEYVEGDITATEGDSYPSGWFTGTDPDAAATPTGSEEGLQVTGRTILLYGETIDITSGEQFAALLDSAAFDADGAVTYQIPMFFNSGDDADLQFSTLRPSDDGAPDGEWGGTGAVAAFGPGTTEEIALYVDELIADGQVPQILAFGIIVPSGDALVRSISFDGDNHIFTAEPEETTPAPGDDEDDETTTPVEEGDEEGDGSAPVATPVQDRATFTG